MSETPWEEIITKFDRKPNPEFVKVMIDKVNQFYGTANIRFEQIEEWYCCPDTHEQLGKRWAILCDNKPGGIHAEKMNCIIEGMKAGYNACCLYGNQQI